MPERKLPVELLDTSEAEPLETGTDYMQGDPSLAEAERP